MGIFRKPKYLGEMTTVLEALAVRLSNIKSTLTRENAREALEFVPLEGIIRFTKFSLGGR